MGRVGGHHQLAQAAMGDAPCGAVGVKPGPPGHAAAGAPGAGGVVEPGVDHFAGAAGDAGAKLGGAFQNQHFPPSLGQGSGAGEAHHAGTDHDCIKLFHGGGAGLKAQAVALEQAGAPTALDALEGGGEAQAGGGLEGLVAGLKFGEGDAHRHFAAPQGHHVAALAGGQEQGLAVEGVGEAFGLGLEAAQFAKHVDGYQAFRAQAGAAGGVKRLLGQGAGPGVAVKTIHHDEIPRAVVAAVHELGPIGNHHFKAFILGGQAEILVGDHVHLGGDFHHGAACFRQVPVDITAQGAGAQADQQDAAGPGGRAQQQAGQQFAGVFEDEGVGLADAHGALDPVGAKVQVADASVFADVDGCFHGDLGMNGCMLRCNIRACLRVAMLACTWHGTSVQRWALCVVLSAVSCLSPCKRPTRLLRMDPVTTFENFSQELSAIDLEIARLAQLCDIDLTAPGVIEAVLHISFLLK